MVDIEFSGDLHLFNATSIKNQTKDVAVVLQSISDHKIVIGNTKTNSFSETYGSNTKGFEWLAKVNDDGV